MSEIKLKHGKVVIVDDADFEWLNQWKWCMTSRGYIHRNAGTNGYILIHRLIMDAPHGKDVDHINGNRADNRRSNLRVCSRSENLCNKGLLSNNTSGFKGVSRFRKTKWQTYINIQGKRYNLGHFSSKEEAAKVYNEAALKYHGKFARLNNV